MGATKKLTVKGEAKLGKLTLGRQMKSKDSSVAASRTPSSGEQPKRQFVCDLETDEGTRCGIIFSSKRSLTIHKDKVHQIPVHGPCHVMLTPDTRCGIAVTKNQNSVHAATWHQPVKCSLISCEMMFPHKMLMIKHHLDKHGKLLSWMVPLVKRYAPVGLEIAFSRATAPAKKNSSLSEPPKQQLVCEVETDEGGKCGKIFSSKRSLTIHKYRVHQISPFGSCPVMLTSDLQCGIVISKNHRSEHMAAWHIPVKCSQISCKLMFPHKMLMIKHHLDKHGKLLQWMVPLVNNHASMNLDKAMRTSGQVSQKTLSASKQHMGQFVCELETEEGTKCGNTYSVKRTLTRHQVKVHKISIRGPCTVMLTPKRKCGSHISGHNRPKHMRRWHKEIECKAKDCNRVFQHKRLMHEHYRKDHPKTLPGGQEKQIFVCELETEEGTKCGMTYEWKKSLLRHCKTAHQNPETNHKNNPPSSEKHFVCELTIGEGEKCGETFSSEARLHIHQTNLHNLPISGVCDIMLTADRQCGMKISKGKRGGHMRRWHKKCKCHVITCNRIFRHKIFMLEHYDDEHRKSCENRKHGCSGFFVRVEDRKEHERTCDPFNRPYLCGYEDCKAKFKCVGSLRGHLYLKHSLNVMQVQAHLGVKDDTVVEEDSDDEEELAVPAKRFKGDPIPIPMDKDTDREYELFKFGIPEWNFQPMNYDIFYVYYHYGLRVPIFTYQLLIPAFLSHQDKSSNDRRPSFRIDRSLPPIFRRGERDYEGLNVHRGHLVPYSDYMLLPLTSSNTCMYSNVLPMLPSFNQSVWRRVENATAKFAKNHVVTFVVTAGLFSEPLQTVGPMHLPMPNRFAKIMLGLHRRTNHWDLRVYDIPHLDSYPRKKPISDFFGNLEDIESQLGVSLFPTLDKKKLRVNQQKEHQRLGQYNHDHKTILLH